MPKKPHITLVKNSSAPTTKTASTLFTGKFENEVIAEALRSALRHLLSEPGSLVPSDVAILQTLWPLVGEVPAANDLQVALAELLAKREFRQVFVGRDAHLTQVTAPQTDATWPTIQKNMTPKVESIPDEDINFDMRVALDIETERQLLFRVLVVLESIGALLLAREAALWWVGL